MTIPDLSLKHDAADCNSPLRSAIPEIDVVVVARPARRAIVFHANPPGGRVALANLLRLDRLGILQTKQQLSVGLLEISGKKSGDAGWNSTHVDPAIAAAEQGRRRRGGEVSLDARLLSVALPANMPSAGDIEVVAIGFEPGLAVGRALRPGAGRFRPAWTFRSAQGDRALGFDLDGLPRARPRGCVALVHGEHRVSFDAGDGPIARERHRPQSRHLGIYGHGVAGCRHAIPFKPDPHLPIGERGDRAAELLARGLRGKREKKCQGDCRFKDGVSQ